MTTLIHADIFFFVTTITVIVFLILGSIVLIYTIGIMRNIKRASDVIEQRIEAAADHADSMYHSIKDSFLFRMIFGKKRKTTHRKQG